MTTIVDAKEHLINLWGKQEINYKVRYRLMRYTFRMNYNGNTLLYNVVTGQLVVLNQKEVELLNRLPSVCDSTIEQLIFYHFLVPEDYDEHKQVLKLRLILQKYFHNHSSNVIFHYTILPTTACNARCYYCFEQGVSSVTMNEETADAIVEFIAKYCGKDKKISITWFGGEPTIAINRIDRICQKLCDCGILFQSQMITNAYLLNQELVDKAKMLWNLRSVQISVDGIETNYNKIKGFVGVSNNPYQRVMDNIGLLLDKEIYVNLRMNFDIGNYGDFRLLVQEVANRYGGNEYINVRAHPVIGEYKNQDGVVCHGTDEWFSMKIVELNNIADEAGLFKKKGELPIIRFNGCMASSDSSVTITPEGFLVNCPEHLDRESIIGTVREGITRHSINESWKEIGDYPNCINCFLFPYCIRVSNCSAKDKCTYKLLYIQQLTNALKERFDSIMINNLGGICDEI